eukprot:UN15756
MFHLTFTLYSKDKMDNFEAIAKYSIYTQLKTFI